MVTIIAPQHDGESHLGDLKLQMETIVVDILRFHLRDSIYQPDVCKRLGHDLADRIKERIKELLEKRSSGRYRIVVQVYIGQESSLTVNLASQCGTGSASSERWPIPASPKTIGINICTRSESFARFWRRKRRIRNRKVPEQSRIRNRGTQ